MNCVGWFVGISCRNLIYKHVIYHANFCFSISYYLLSPSKVLNWSNFCSFLRSVATMMICMSTTSILFTVILTGFLFYIFVAIDLVCLLREHPCFLISYLVMETEISDCIISVDGHPLSLDEIVMDLPLHSSNTLKESKWTFLTQEVNVLPAWFLWYRKAALVNIAHIVTWAMFIRQEYWSSKIVVILFVDILHAVFR